MRSLFALLLISTGLLSATCNKTEEPDELALQRARMEARRLMAERFERIPSRERAEGLEGEMQDAGLIDIQDMDSTIRVELKYGGADNFLDSNVYGELQNAYLRVEAAAMLSLAQEKLQDLKPGYSLLVYDAARPVSVQERMWSLVVGTSEQNYVASPGTGSLHNYGAAVDLTICRPDGVPLDMGTPFDHFGRESQPRHESSYLNSGALNREQIENRKLLRKVMASGGFKGIPTEWWHFNAYPLEHVKRNFEQIP
jgi:D-alanyl-D-alanine dipeptidase